MAPTPARAGARLPRLSAPSHGCPALKTRRQTACCLAVATGSGSIAQARVDESISELSSLSDVRARLAALASLASDLPPFNPAWRTPEHQVMGCTSQVWLQAELHEDDGTVIVHADSTSMLTRGLAALLVRICSGLAGPDILALDFSALADLDVGSLAQTPSRANSFRNMLETLKKRVMALQGELPRFPSLLVTADSLEPQGEFARAQARYLRPDAAKVEELARLLSTKRIGIVAHFYMDPEVQGVLMAAKESWEHIAVSDSLVMADRAMAMAQAGCKAVCVLGVDFMSENVRAILDQGGFADVAVYRMASDAIGCSLAEAAEAPAYEAYLRSAAEQPGSLHVVYINTSLRTKATADALVPTITCTSSNVVSTILQTFAQVPDAHVWYGPDTYMGRNLQHLLSSIAEMDDEHVRQLHPAHTAASVAACLPRLHHFQDGTCIVHHIFGGETAAAVRTGYSDAFITAHLEVPGEMFSLAVDAQRERGMGVVGSTSDILGFITRQVEAALARGFRDRLQFVLGTEAGMISSIVARVQGLLRRVPEAGVEVEVVFPVAKEAIVAPGVQEAGVGGPVELPGGLAVVPGVAAGEGCSTEGGCAACPYMKMNSLDALLKVCERVGSPAGEATLEAFKPNAYTSQVNGVSIAEAGCTSILRMRHFQQHKTLPDELADKLQTRPQS